MASIRRLAAEFVGWYCAGCTFNSENEKQNERRKKLYVAEYVLYWFRRRPLAERLTEREKAKIIEYYQKTYPEDIDRDSSNARVQFMLEDIFGKEYLQQEYNIEKEKSLQDK